MRLVLIFLTLVTFVTGCASTLEKLMSKIPDGETCLEIKSSVSVTRVCIVKETKPLATVGDK